jgi:uncharacterized protein (TIGR00251 family)
VAAIVSEHDAGAVLVVMVTPRAGKTGIVRIEADAVRIRLAAAPVDGAANAALLRYLADVLDRPRSSLRLLGGETGRRKRVLVTGLSPAELTRRIEQITGGELA